MRRDVLYGISLLICMVSSEINIPENNIKPEQSTVNVRNRRSSSGEIDKSGKLDQILEEIEQALPKSDFARQLNDLYPPKHRNENKDRLSNKLNNILERISNKLPFRASDLQIDLDNPSESRKFLNELGRSNRRSLSNAREEKGPTSENNQRDLNVNDDRNKNAASVKGDSPLNYLTKDVKDKLSHLRRFIKLARKGNHNQTRKFIRIINTVPIFEIKRPVYKPGGNILKRYPSKGKIPKKSISQKTSESASTENSAANDSYEITTKKVEQNPINEITTTTVGINAVLDSIRKLLKETRRSDAYETTRRKRDTTADDIKKAAEIREKIERSKNKSLEGNRRAGEVVAPATSAEPVTQPSPPVTSTANSTTEGDSKADKVKTEVYAFIEETMKDIKTKVAGIHSLQKYYANSKHFKIGYTVSNINHLFNSLTSLYKQIESNKLNWDEVKVLKVYGQLKKSDKNLTNIEKALINYIKGSIPDITDMPLDIEEQMR